MIDGTEGQAASSEEQTTARMSRRRMLATVAVGTGAAWVAPAVLSLVPTASATSAPCTTPKYTTDCKLVRNVCAFTPEGSDQKCAISYQWGTNGWESCQPTEDDFKCLGGTSTDYGSWTECDKALTCSGDQTNCDVSTDPSNGGGQIHGGFVVFDTLSPTTPIVNPTQPGSLGWGGQSINFRPAS